MRYCVTLCLVLALILGVGAAASTAAQELTVWVQGSEIRRQQYAAIIDWFKLENPGLEVSLHLVPGNQTAFTERLVLAIASGSAPDLTWIEGSTVVEMAASGLLEDVTEMLEGLTFTPADTEEMTFAGRLWAAPYHTSVRALFRRVDLFNEVGLDPYEEPASLDDLRDWSQKLDVPTPEAGYQRVGWIPWEGNWGAPGWMWTFGGQLLDKERMQPTALHPNNIKALAWLQDWAQGYGNVTPARGDYVGFQGGSVAMVLESTTAAGLFVQSSTEFTTSRVPSPVPGANGTWGGGTAVAIPANAPNKDAAKALLRYFASAEVQARRFREFPEAIPANWDALLEVVGELPPSYAGLLEQFPEARPRTPLWIDYFLRHLNPAVQQVIAGQTTPLGALETVQRVMEARFAEVFGS